MSTLYTQLTQSTITLIIVAGSCGAAVEQIVDVNQAGHALWTVWDHDASTTVNPSIYLQEICSVNVVLDYLHLTDTIFNFTELNLW